MSPYILIIGKTGQLARALAQRASAHKIDAAFYGREDLDLSAPDDDIIDFLARLPKCDGIIIAAAYTAVDKAETDKDTAYRVNCAAPEHIARACALRNIPLVHVSTDYVFSGLSSEPFRVDDETDPINAYGASKLAGEQAIAKTGARSAILRTSWVFDGLGKNFMTTMLRLGQTHDALNVVSDQIGRPTYAGDLADACLAAMKKLIGDKSFQGGIYHVTGAGPAVSWAGFAQSIFKQFEVELGRRVTVKPIPASQYPTPAKRPSYSVMDIRQFVEDFSYPIPSWSDGIKSAKIEYLANKTQ